MAARTMSEKLLESFIEVLALTRYAHIQYSRCYDNVYIILYLQQLSDFNFNYHNYNFHTSLAR